MEELVDLALPDWTDGSVDPAVNDSHNDPRFSWSVELDNSVRLDGCALRHRFHRGRGSVVKSLDDNFLYGKRATLAERHWPADAYRFVENRRLVSYVTALLACQHPVFQTGAMTLLYAGYTGESGQFRIATPAFLASDESPVPPDKYLITAMLLLSDVDDETGPLRVIPGSHARYAEINAHVARRLQQSETRNNIPAARPLWEELLPDGLRAPVTITGRKGSVILMHSHLLRGSTANRTHATAGKSILLHFSCRDHAEFLRIASHDGKARRRVSAGFTDKSLVRETYMPGVRSLARARASEIAGHVRGFYRDGWKAPIRPVYYGLKRLTKPRNRPLAEKQYLNIGAGHRWRHPKVICLDHDLPNAEVALDLNYRVPLPFADARFDGVYMSHCMEHLKESQARWWLDEIVRTLRPGGVFRITSPDIKGYLDAYDARDGKYFDWIQGRGAYRFDSWLRLIVRMFAEPVVDNYDDAELHRLYASMSRAEFLEFFNAQVEAVTDELLLNPSCHKSWWSGEKMQAALIEAGFSTASVKSQDESDCEVFAEKVFNRTRPYMSFFAEGIK